MPKLIFIIDQGYDSKMIYQMLKAQKNASSFDYQIKIMEISQASAKKIMSAKSFGQIKNFLGDLTKKRYQGIGHDLEKSKIDYQNSWDKINDDFFKRIVKITNFPIQHRTYYCVVSAFHLGISSWGGNKIVRKYGLDPLRQRRITAHEIIISHFFSLIDTNYPNILSKEKTWQLAEIFAFAVTGEDKILKTFWPWDKSGSYINHNYPEIVPLQKILTKIYLEKGFGMFLKQGIRKQKAD